MILNTLTVGSPLNNVSLTETPAAAPGYSISGTSDPAKPLYMNGAEVVNRTVEGFFFVYAPLETGDNVFTFSQDGQDDVTRIITRKTPAAATPSPSPSASPAPGPVITEVTEPVYATIASDEAWVYSKNSTAGGSDWMMARGQTDRVVAEASNGYEKLSCGVWIPKSQVTLQTETVLKENMLKSGEYVKGADHDMVVWKSDVYIGAYAAFDGQTLTVSFGMQTEPPPLTLPDDLSSTVFSSVASGKSGGTPFIAFTMKDNAKLDGYYIDYADSGLRLHMRTRKSLSAGDKPLAGITIVLDPGHGGGAYGAIGPMGNGLAEKDLNLTNSFKLADRLTALGATVQMTRTADEDISLQARVDISNQVKPDLFISLHINSVAEITNPSNVHGFTVWYRNPCSADLSQTLLDYLYYINPATNRNRSINQANNFVCRPQWAPSVIVEASFIVNLDDFVWLIDPAQQDRMADTTVEAILQYFG